MYSVNLHESVISFLKKLEKVEEKRILKKFEDLRDNPELGKPLTGNLAGLWSLRIGKYRALYRILKDKLIIIIIKIGHRKNIYDN